LGVGNDAVWKPNEHPKEVGSGPAVEPAHPLEPLLVVVTELLPALAREPHEILLHVETVALGLHRLDAVHDATRRSRTAHALSSGWRESGSRAESVRLLALL